MKIKKESSENNPRFKMMEGGITLKEITKWYGKATADALVEYCDKNGLSIDDVAESDREWDRFEKWSKSRKRGLGRYSSKFNGWQDAARIDEPEDGERAVTRYDMPTDSDIYGESTEECAACGQPLNLKSDPYMMRKGKPVCMDCYENGEAIMEGSGSRMDEFDILNWIYEEMRDCEWAEIDE